MEELQLRSEIVRVANEWVGTPYRERACIKKKGCECATFLYGVGKEVGLVPQDYVPPGGYYSMAEAFMHRGGDKRYLEEVQRFAREITEAEVQPGDIILYQVGRGFSHSAFVIRWPDFVIHAAVKYGVVGAHGTREGFFIDRIRRYFSFFGK